MEMDKWNKWHLIYIQLCSYEAMETIDPVDHLLQFYSLYIVSLKLPLLQ